MKSGICPLYSSRRAEPAAALCGKISDACSKPRQVGRRKSPAQSNLRFGRPASPTPFTLDSGNLPSLGASQRGNSPQVASDLPSPRFAASPAPGGSLAEVPFCLWRPHAPQRRRSAAPRTSRVRPAARRHVPIAPCCAQGLPLERRREPRIRRGREPESPRCGKSCVRWGR